MFNTIKKSCMSNNTTEERHQFLLTLPVIYSYVSLSGYVTQRKEKLAVIKLHKRKSIFIDITLLTALVVGRVAQSV